MATVTGEDLQTALGECVAEGRFIYPPKRQLDPALYAELKKRFTENRGEWKGGKAQCFEFPMEAEELLEQLRAGKRPNFKQDSHFFYTPATVVDEMCNIHILMDGHRILEPSAGQGHLIDAVNAFIRMENAHEWTVIEPDPVNRKILEEKGYPPVHDDFDTWETDLKFEMCYANPPFKKDTDHVEKIASLIEKGGSMVVVLPETWPHRNKRNKELMAQLEDQFESVMVRKLPHNAFKETGTGVSTIILAALYKHDE